MPVAGVPANISFEIVGGTAQDGIHAMYKKGSSVKLRAIIRDGYGNIITPTADHPCTPQFSLEDTATPSGGSRATLSPGDIVNFVGDGPFTVSVACREHPEINSHSNTQPYNFETNNTSPFAHDAHAAEAAPAAGGGMNLAEVLLIVAGGAALAYLVVDEATASQGGGGSCGCRCAYGGDDCSNGGTAFCTNLYNFPVGCAATDPRGVNCNCANGATARVAPPRTVDELVASGFRQRPVRTVRAVAAHVARDGAQRTTRTITPSSSHLREWIGGTLVAASLATTAYLLWTHAHPHRVEVTPYVGPSGGGLSILGRF